MLFTVSLLGLLGLNLLTVALYVVTSILSSRGSLIRPKPRAKVVVAVYLLILVSLVELAWLVLSTYSAVDVNLAVNATVGYGGSAAGMGSDEELLVSGYGGSNESGEGEDPIGSGIPVISCPAYESAVSLFSVLVGIGWVVYVVILLSFLALLDPCGLCLGSRFVNRISKTQKYHKEEYSEVVEKPLTEFDKFDSVKGRYSNAVGSSILSAKLRETFCFCGRRDGLKNSRAEALSDVVQVLRILFSDLDVTFSDLLAGFLLASLYQRKLKAAGKNRDHELNEVRGCHNIIVNITLQCCRRRQ